MPTTAEQLLSALEPLPFPARLDLTARTAHRLACEGRLAPLLTGLDARGPYERRLAALAAFAGRDAGFLAARLADPDEVVAGYALRAARVLPVPDEAVEAAYDDAPAVRRQRLARLLASGGRTTLAERLVARLGTEWGDAEAARLLPACSTPFVARELPRLAHAVDGWTKLARRHPDPVLDHCEAALADRAGGRQQQEWWRLNATTVAALARRRPERVLALLERHGPESLPPALCCGLGPLVDADAERVVRWITDPARREQRFEPIPPTGVLRRLVQAAPPSLPELGRHWLRRTGHFAALLRAMAPGRRPAFLDTVSDGSTPGEPALAVLDLLPRERRWAEVRRAAAEFTGGPDWWDDLDTLAHGPFGESRTELLAAVRRPDADDRAAAWPLLVACAARDGGREAVGEVLALAERLRNDRDPVRTAALHALTTVRPRLFAADDAVPLDRIAADALEARDCSAAGLTALRTLAERVLAEHAGDGETALRTWALRTLERIAGRVGVPDLGPLHRVLRRGQEHEVFEALRPWLEAAAGRSDFRLLLALADALGPRARRMPDLQDLLALALERGDDSAFEAAAARWLAAPATRGERVARIIALEPSAVVLPPVRHVLARYRTDLLDTLLGEEPPCGRFLVPGARRPLPDLAAVDRWLPRQQRAAARLAGQTAADGSVPSDDRAAAIRAAAPVPELGHALAMRHKDDGDVVVAEAALAALAWADRPQDALPALLEQAGGDRARVAVYAAGRTARFTAPSELALALGALLTGERAAKVTSRKEAARLCARFLPPQRAVALLAHAFRAPDSHPDVRTAVLRALPPLLDVPEAWHLLEEAVHDDAPPVLQAVAEVSPWELAAAHRAGYAAVVDRSYDACLASYDGYASHGVLRAVADWARYAPGLAVRLSRTVCDLGGRRHWQHAAWVLRDLAASDLPHPVGGAAPGSALHGAVSELLAAMHTSEGGRDALADRDLPALQRLRTLVSPATDRPERPELLRAVAGLLAREPLLVSEHADLLRRLVDHAVEPAAVLERLRELTEALEGAGVTVTVQTAGRLRTDRIHGALSRRGGALLAAADRLARDGGTVTGLLAAGLVTGTGCALGWPEEWRSLLRLLRGHPHPDVRHQAYQRMTARESCL
ncbi:hypothetical protein J2Z21_004567 [Streptomyces griseochromogenes]|uniref:Uncharacterized protein n=1 Tax=Streptomyces griseochromogenes TaxID=68214 RepID=A0A1B1AW73_9ACTN|nr:hypothetical protein [Streptomyces griseochromogenes]ANP50787.1 hypothetical protein AVL59_15180 [Streptomyces griseochromogenes]MBP2051596.1 hypothetical protein [Streptomyces griseochromogenes]